MRLADWDIVSPEQSRATRVNALALARDYGHGGATILHAAGAEEKCRPAPRPVRRRVLDIHFGGVENASSHRPTRNAPVAARRSGPECIAKSTKKRCHLITFEPQPRKPEAAPTHGPARLKLTSAWRALTGRAVTRECLIFLAFCAMTAAVTWPYVTRLRDAVVDPGDPYLVAWILWWDYHATFTDPLNLFHSNVFYPYRYTLAFSEHGYGIAALFFPLFALGARPLTVHAVAMFFGFVASGYGAFRLGRTLTGSYGVAWVAGIIFAFVPHRFNMMSQLVYLFSPWVPLLFEALVLFARERSRKRAAWLGVAFFMSGLTTISWLTLSLVPFALAAAVLLTRYGLWRERAFWRRGAAALGLASLGLLPFMLPYYIAAKLYGFTRRIEEVKAESAWPIHWLSVEVRNKFWSGFGGNTPEGWRFKLFPGLLPLLLSLAALLMVGPPEGRAPRAEEGDAPKRSLLLLDAFIVLAFVASVFAVGYEGLNVFGGLFNHVTSERALSALLVACVARLCLAYPNFLRRGGNANLVETLRSPRRSDAFWLGVLWTAVGFCYSLGWNFFFYRILYDLVPLFRSMRVVTRGAMIAYLGLALLGGLGAARLAEAVARRRPRLRPPLVYAALCALLLFELNAAPLRFMRGDVYPDAVTLRLKETPMRGGIVVLPAGADFNHRHILRAADHAKPLIVGTSGFITPYEYEIETMTRSGPITMQFLDLLEKIPASYLVVQTQLVPPERRDVFEIFLARSVTAGRLRFIRRFDGRDDLYAVAKTEPEARGEEALPFGLSVREWAALVEDDPVNLLGQYEKWSQEVFRLTVASFGRLPRYEDFMRDVREVGRGVLPGFEEQDQQLENNLREFAEAWVRREEFRSVYDGLTDAQYVERLLSNAGLALGEGERAGLAGELASGYETRAGVLLKVARNRQFVEREHRRSFVVLHYFGYLRRNPDDPPDTGLGGVQFWVEDLERTNDPSRISNAFKESIEYAEKSGKGKGAK
jgi:hypothetical protein